MKLKTIYRISLPTMALMTIANVMLIVYVYFKMGRPVHYNVNVVEPPVFDLPSVTNTLQEAKEGLISSPRQTTVQSVVVHSKPENSPYGWRHRYHYFVANGRRTAYLNGVYVREGDTHAYGVVRSIYPERIYFEGGNYIDNTTTGGLENERISTADTTIP